MVFMLYRKCSDDKKYDRKEGTMWINFRNPVRMMTVALWIFLVLVHVEFGHAEGPDEVHTVQQCYGKTMSLECHPDFTVRVIIARYGQSERCSEGQYSNFCSKEEPGNPACVGNSTCTFTTPWLYLSPECGYSNSFDITYQCIPRGLQRDICRTDTVSDLRGFISSPRYPAKYQAAQDCKVKVTVPEGYRMNIFLLDLYLAYYKHDVVKRCIDRLWISDEGDKTNYMCTGQQRGLVFTTRANQAEIFFVSDDHSFRNAKGFWLYYEAFKAPSTISSVSPQLTTPEEHLTTPASMISSTLLSTPQETTTPIPSTSTTTQATTSHARSAPTLQNILNLDPAEATPTKPSTEPVSRLTAAPDQRQITHSFVPKADFYFSQGDKFISVADLVINREKVPPGIVGLGPRENDVYGDRSGVIREAPFRESSLVTAPNTVNKQKSQSFDYFRPNSPMPWYMQYSTKLRDRPEQIPIRRDHGNQLPALPPTRPLLWKVTPTLSTIGTETLLEYSPTPPTTTISPDTDPLPAMLEPLPRKPWALKQGPLLQQQEPFVQQHESFPLKEISEEVNHHVSQKIYSPFIEDETFISEEIPTINETALPEDIKEMFLRRFQTPPPQTTIPILAVPMMKHVAHMDYIKPDHAVTYVHRLPTYPPTVSPPTFHELHMYRLNPGDYWYPGRNGSGNLSIMLDEPSVLAISQHEPGSLSDPPPGKNRILSLWEIGAIAGGAAGMVLMVIAISITMVFIRRKRIRRLYKHGQASIRKPYKEVILAYGSSPPSSPGLHNLGFGSESPTTSMEDMSNTTGSLASYKNGAAAGSVRSWRGLRPIDEAIEDLYTEVKQCSGRIPVLSRKAGPWMKGKSKSLDDLLVKSRLQEANRRRQEMATIGMSLSLESFGSNHYDDYREAEPVDDIDTDYDRAYYHSLGSLYSDLALAQARSAMHQYEMSPCLPERGNIATIPVTTMPPYSPYPRLPGPRQSRNSSHPRGNVTSYEATLLDREEDIAL